MMLTIIYKRILGWASIALAAFGVAVMAGYALAGHALIRYFYESDWAFVDQYLNRSATPLGDYIVALDRTALSAAIYCLLGALALVLLRNPVGLILSCVSLSLGTLVIFVLLDLFPVLVKPLHFDIIPYFNYRLTYVPDPVLGFRERPYNESQIDNYRGYAYSPLFGIDVPPQTIRWSTDEKGFRNPPGRTEADIIVIGSSFPEYGETLADTYPMVLERKLGRTVINLGKAGYGPLQYLKALERYGLRKKPEYVLITFYVPVDVGGHLADWTYGRDNAGLAKRSIAFGGFFPRYWIALSQTAQFIGSAVWTPLQLGFQNLLGSQFVHPEVAVLQLPGGAVENIRFEDRCSTQSPEELLRSPEWRAVEKVFAEFKRESEEHRFAPVLVYIPAATEVYAEYSTEASGTSWRVAREACVLSSGTHEETVRRLTSKLGIELVSLLPAYKAAARQGRMLYYPLDTHWNAEGREIAAEVTAQVLRARDNGDWKAREKIREPRRHTGQVHVKGGKQGVYGSVMTRTLEGKIESWDQRAEQLYGWRKEEVVGRVSHDLLQTEFPEPLEQINAKLMQNGSWHGKLVHATRDGRRMVVQSHWLLDRSRTNGVTEINARSTG